MSGVNMGRSCIIVEAMKTLHQLAFEMDRPPRSGSFTFQPGFLTRRNAYGRAIQHKLSSYKRRFPMYYYTGIDVSKQS